MLRYRAGNYKIPKQCIRSTCRKALLALKKHSAMWHRYLLLSNEAQGVPCGTGIYCCPMKHSAMWHRYFLLSNEAQWVPCGTDIYCCPMKHSECHVAQVFTAIQLSTVSAMWHRYLLMSNEAQCHVAQIFTAVQWTNEHVSAILNQL